MATGPLGEGDAYWVKAWKNDVFLGKPEEPNMVYDGGFSASNSVDGEVSILPIRRDFINPLDKANDNDTQFIPPYQVGDSITVEIHSLDHAAFDFLIGVYFNINRPGGFGELFAFPLTNSIHPGMEYHEDNGSEQHAMCANDMGRIRAAIERLIAVN